MNFSQITPWLLVGTTPSEADYALLKDLGVGLVINLRLEHRPRRDPSHPPMQTLWLPAIDSPLFPIPVRTLYKGVKAALAVMEGGQAVYTHCAGGRHRAPAQAAAILVAQGLTAQAAMTLIKQMRPAADPFIWYIRRPILRFSAAWQADLHRSA